MARKCDFLIVGSGIAGASAAYELAAERRVILTARVTNRVTAPATAANIAPRVPVRAIAHAAIAAAAYAA